MKRKRTLLFMMAGLLVSVALLAACSSSPTTSGTTTTTSPGAISFNSSIQPIFNERCVFCHQGGSPPGGLSLEPAVAYKDLVNAPSSQSPLVRVAPGVPDKSYLMNKLTGTQVQAGGSGEQMPFGSTPLPQAQIDLISLWISAGAPDN